jgi:hypothetical protein
VAAPWPGFRIPSGSSDLTSVTRRLLLARSVSRFDLVGCRLSADLPEQEWASAKRPALLRLVRGSTLARGRNGPGFEDT